MRLLGGMEDKIVREKGNDRRGKDEDEEISEEEVKRVITKLKDGKAAKINGIPNEVVIWGRDDRGMGQGFVTGSGKEKSGWRDKKRRL